MEFWIFILTMVVLVIFIFTSLGVIIRDSRNERNAKTELSQYTDSFIHYNGGNGMSSSNVGNTNGERFCGSVVRSVSKCNRDYRKEVENNPDDDVEEIATVLTSIASEMKYDSYEKNCLLRAARIIRQVSDLANGRRKIN